MMYSMTKRGDGKLNQLMRELPQGLFVDASWMTAHDYSRSLRSQYVSGGWLEQPAYGVYRRPQIGVRWEQVVISLQTMLGKSLLVGGRTSLDLQGLGHYLAADLRDIHLYGPTPPPGWIDALGVAQRFRYHNSGRLFRDDPLAAGPVLVQDADALDRSVPPPLADSARKLPAGQGEWPLVVSTPERALLETIDGLPGKESFHQVDKLVEGLSTLSPRRMAALLRLCRSVKVKRLFFYFATRHGHAWLSRLDPKDFDLGSGKRVLVRGGRLDPQFQITLPEDLDADA
ncbi:type IV toxin-antitoxin system AbiEi family antitoxin domain-containing protein [Phenylobacterium kunshanense]